MKIAVLLNEAVCRRNTPSLELSTHRYLSSAGSWFNSCSTLLYKPHTLDAIQSFWSQKAELQPAAPPPTTTTHNPQPRERNPGFNGKKLHRSTEMCANRSMNSMVMNYENNSQHWKLLSHVRGSDLNTHTGHAEHTLYCSLFQQRKVTEQHLVSGTLRL